MAVDRPLSVIGLFNNNQITTLNTEYLDSRNDEERREMPRMILSGLTIRIGRTLSIGFSLSLIGY